MSSVSNVVPEAAAAAPGRNVSAGQPLTIAGSFAAEQYRVLAHEVERFLGDRKPAVIGVTSPAVGDGKTTTCLHLAATLAEAPGARVLLIDGDLRRPAVAKRLGLAESLTGNGLAEALIDPSLSLAAVVRREAAGELAVLPAGGSPDAPYELLRSSRMGEVLSAARAAYDFVVLDTPPVLLVPDCRGLARWVDVFLMVVAAHETPRKLLEEALSVMEPSQLAGLVFNNDDRPLSGYYRRYSSYYPSLAPRGAGSRKVGSRSWP